MGFIKLLHHAVGYHIRKLHFVYTCSDTMYCALIAAGSGQLNLCKICSCRVMNKKRYMKAVCVSYISFLVSFFRTDADCKPIENPFVRRGAI